MDEIERAARVDVMEINLPEAKGGYVAKAIVAAVEAVVDAQIGAGNYECANCGRITPRGTEHRCRET